MGIKTGITYRCFENQKLVHEGKLVLDSEDRIPKAISAAVGSPIYRFDEVDTEIDGTIVCHYSFDYDARDVVYI